MASLRQIPLSCSGHTRPVVHVDFSGITPDGYFLISACKDGKPMLRQGETGDWVGTFDGHKGAVWGASLNLEATRAATGAADFTAKVWDPVSGDELHSFAHRHIVKAVHFSKDSGRLLTGSNEKKIRIFDLAKVEADPVEIPAHTSNIRCTLWCDNDKKLLSASDDKTICVWDAANHCEIKRITMDTSNISMDISKDGDVCVISHGNKISFYDTDKFELIKTFDAPCTINSASLHPDKSCLVAGGEDLKIYKFDYSDGKELESYKGHFGPVHCIRFSPDGELYASGSEDGTLRLWQTTLGKSYGLWKCIDPEEAGLESCPGEEVATPQVVTLQEVTPQDVTPKDMTLQDVTLKELTPQDVTPQEVALQDLAPQVVTPQDVTPQEVTPQEVTPQEVTQQDVTPKDVTPQEVTPKDVTPKDVTPQDVTPQVVTPEVVTPQAVQAES